MVTEVSICLQSLLPEPGRHAGRQTEKVLVISLDTSVYYFRILKNKLHAYNHYKLGTYLYFTAGNVLLALARLNAQLIIESIKTDLLSMFV